MKLSEQTITRLTTDQIKEFYKKVYNFYIQNKNLIQETDTYKKTNGQLFEIRKIAEDLAEIVGTTDKKYITYYSMNEIEKEKIIYRSPYKKGCFVVEIKKLTELFNGKK
jgi:hypothetical protein